LTDAFCNYSARRKILLVAKPTKSLYRETNTITRWAKPSGIPALGRAAHELGDALLQFVFLEMFGDPLVNDKGWKVRTLRSVSSKFSDGLFGSDLKSEHYVSEGVRVICLQNIGIGNLIDNDQAYISEEHFAELSKHRCLPGDVIVGTMGDPNLRAMILPDSIPRALNKADCVQARVNPKICNNQFICWLVNMPQTLQLASGMIHGQTRARINMGRLAELEVPIPPLSLQEEFVGVVARVESLPLAAKRLGDFVRGRMGESTRQVEGLFESLLSQSFDGGQ
jgi:type I restriction enzyme, S subunit